MNKPLIIFNKKRIVLALSLQNDKAYKKSIEQNTLWFVHEETGRVLPHPENLQLISAAEKDGWYEAEVVSNTYGESEKAESADLKSKDSMGMSDTDILSELQELLVSRKKEMPEGSYTTHLFSSGADKIRKKTGEEAVELILARENEEIISETADLIYHTMVLFAALDLNFNDVFKELKSRHS